MIKKGKSIIALCAALIIACGVVIIYHKEKADKNISTGNSNEILVPESINDIPPGIIDNVAPDVEQEFKAEAKDFEAHDENGNEIRLSDYKGQYIVLNFWNSTCEPCVNELPYFEEAIKKYEGRVTFLMVNMVDGNNKTKESALNYLQNNGLDIKTIFDDHYDVRVNYRVTSLPRTLFIDKNRLIQKDIKIEMTKEMLEEQIDNLINNEK
ncbi:TlpA disulfide reductase family protein [uncultured Clostridium sp.]|uniref:TlpA family protein disulfide reductase n=1 Tax=uncultured Clostridium sp. TaxID=59620 RepID=UPI0025E97771|nr:TlpA disulfide reductase family protein [uncultured Clostridium sp.]